MKTYQSLLAVLLVLSSFAQAQDAKRQLRDFTPKYTIDTFQVKGASSSMNRRVIQMLDVKGIKSAYWDNQSSVATVQYDKKLLKLSFIKSLFTSHKSISELIKDQGKINSALVSIGTIPYSYSKQKNFKK